MPETKKYNKNPISLRDGHAYLDGVEVMNGIKLELKATPEVAKSRYFNEKTSNSRWIGMEYTGNMTRHRSTGFLIDKIKEYMDTGITPELTITGVSSDKNSDYYDETGMLTVKALGCVLTGDIPLLSLDTGGEFMEENIGFNIKKVITSSKKA